MIKKNTGENLLRYHWKDYKLLILDFETCNLNLACNNLPWEIGYILMDHGKKTVSENRRIWWEDLNMSADAARITRFSWSDYKQSAEDPTKVLKDFEKELYDKNTINITFNGLNFDMYLHQLWRKELGLPTDWSFVARSIDVLALSRAYKLGLTPPDNWEDFIFWQTKLINYYEDSRLRKDKKAKLGGSTTLGAMAKHFGINVDELKTHGGLYDVELTWAVFEKLMWKMDLTTDILKVE